MTSKQPDKLKLYVKVHVERLANLHQKVSTKQPLGSKKVQQVRFTCSNQTPNVHKRLRKRKINNYAELSLCSCSPAEKSLTCNNQIRVPIYLQQNLTTAKSRNVKDPFEFVAETPRAYRRRLLQEKLRTDGCFDSEGDSVLYDKDMHKILKKLEAKEQARAKAEKRAANKRILRNVPAITKAKLVPSKTTENEKQESHRPKNLRNLSNILDESDDHTFVFSSESENEEPLDIPVRKQFLPITATSTPQPSRESTLKQASINGNSPWRSDSDQISRHPYFLAVKNTSLPSYNQPMVLNSKLDTPMVHKSPHNSIIQTSILDYMEANSSLPETPSKALIEQSLFDNSQFSPIKQPKITRRQTPKSKRNVFGILKPSNNTNLPKPSQEYRIDNYFGFESGDENFENKENRTKTRKMKRKAVVEAQPTRFAIKQANNLRQNIIAEMLENDDAPVQDFSEEQAPDDVPTVALFEDLEPVQRPQHPRRSYERKRPRRVRLKSVDSVMSEESIKPKVKRKDKRTPQEEAAYNKWILEFNAMCEEVENHTLETE